MILKKFVCGAFDTNTFFIMCENTKKAAVIDPALGAKEKVLSFAKKEKATIASIFLTHSHWDHTGDVAKIKKDTNATIYVHKLDSDNLTNPGADKLPLLENIEGITPDKYLEDKEKLKVGDIELEVIHTPGHTPGCVCLYVKAEKTLFSGDTLFEGSIGNLSFPTAQPDLMWTSLKKLSKLPPDTKVYPGHGNATSIGKESWLANAKEYFL